MSDKKSRGVVLREVDYKESDRLLTVLTDNSGLITLKVRGIRKSKFLYRGACEILSWSDFTYREFGGYYTLSEADCLENFAELRTDIEKLSLAMYFGQVAELLSQEDAPTDRILRLLLNVLYAIAKTTENLEKIKAAFEWKASILAGYEANLSGCTVCHTQYPDRLLINHGVLCCSNCISEEHTGIRMPVTLPQLSALRFISSVADKKMLSFSLETGDYTGLADLTEAYLLTQLEHGFAALDLYKSLNYNSLEF